MDEEPKSLKGSSRGVSKKSELPLRVARKIGVINDIIGRSSNVSLPRNKIEASPLSARPLAKSTSAVNALKEVPLRSAHNTPTLSKMPSEIVGSLTPIKEDVTSGAPFASSPSRKTATPMKNFSAATSKTALSSSSLSLDPKMSREVNTNSSSPSNNFSELKKSEELPKNGVENIVDIAPKNQKNLKE